MDKQALEIMALAMPTSYSIGQQYGTLDDSVIDFNTSGATAMYNPGSHMAGCTCPLCVFSFMDREKRDKDAMFGQIRRTPIGGVIPYGNLTGLGGDVHDTFKADGDGNTSYGHTTINIPIVKPLRISWEKEQD